MSTVEAPVGWDVALAALLEDAGPVDLLEVVTGRWLPRVRFGPGPGDGSWPSWNGTPCWVWTGAQNRRGYGRMQIGGRMFYAHRVGLALAGVVLPPPDELEVDHLCLHRPCVRADHLELVTHEENLRRHYDAQGACLRGHPRTDENVFRDARGRIKYCRVCKREMRSAGAWS